MGWTGLDLHCNGGYAADWIGIHGQLVGAEHIVLDICELVMVVGRWDLVLVVMVGWNEMEWDDRYRIV